MLVSCWSAKGGSGTTVVAAAIAGALSAGGSPGAVLADLTGDAALALGVPDPSGPGLGDWSRAGSEVPLDALRRIEVEVRPGLSVLARGACGVDPLRAEALAAALGDDPRAVVADCGTLADPSAGEAVVAAAAARSLLVLRPCYLALRRALQAPVTADGVILVAEPGRSLSRADVEAVLDLPVVVEVPVDPAVARAVDAGLLAGRMPAALRRPMERLAKAVAA